MLIKMFLQVTRNIFALGIECNVILNCSFNVFAYKIT